MDSPHEATPEGYGRIMLGLPDGVHACLFDLDGVLTSTASLHREAWKRTFDRYLSARQSSGVAARSTECAEFTEEDYATYVDGKPRPDGVRSFLASRAIDLPCGDPDDGPERETVHGLGNRKNTLVHQLIEARGVQTYPGSVRYLQAVRRACLPIAVVTSSANATMVLDVAGLTGFVDAQVDGTTISRDGLRGKPAPDSYVTGAEALGVKPSEAAVFEDALAGVEAGRAGSFGLVVGVNRAAQAAELRDHGADIVVDDLAELLQENTS